MSSPAHLVKTHWLSRNLVIVGLLSLVGLLLRLWKIGFGLPDLHFSNEELTTYPALNLASGDLNPHTFYHPNFYYYLFFAADLAYILLGFLTGHFKAPGDGWELFKTDPTVFYVIGRSISAVLGTLTIPLTYWMGKKLFGERTGVLGALFLTFCFVHVQWSQIAYMDAPLIFFVVVSFLFALFALETGKTRYFMLCGLTGGLAASTKYQGIETLYWGPLASLLYDLNRSRVPLGALWNQRSWTSVLFFIVGFTGGTPFWILSFPEFFAHLRDNWLWFNPSGQGHVGMEGNWNWAYYLMITLPYSIGIPVLVSALAGLIVLLGRMERRIFLFLSFPTVYFFIAGFSKIRQAKYLMPMIPFLCLAAGFFLVWGVEKFFARKKWAPWILSVAGLFAVLPVLVSDLRYAYLKTLPDTRNLANTWVDVHVPLESKMAVTSATMWGSRPKGPKVVDLDPTLFDQRVNNRSSLRSLEEYRKEGFEYIVLDEWHLGSLFAEEAKNPKYHPTLQRYQRFLEDLKGSAELVAVFSPYQDDTHSFDRENVSLASRDLWNLKSLGPRVQIYQLGD